MRKVIWYVAISFLMIVSACGGNTSVNSPTPTETESPMISFTTPLSGATISYEEMDFQINPVPGAEGYAWVFIQNGTVLLDTLKDQQRLTDTEYQVPDMVTLNKNFIPGELQVQVRARINGTWTEPTTIIVYLPERAIVDILENTQTPIFTNIAQPTKSLSTNAVTPTPQPGWLTYVNDYLGYQFNYPPAMKVHADGFTGMDLDQPIPPGFTFDEYFTYLEDIFPETLCVWVESNAGMVAIAPPDDSIGSFATPCPGMGIGDGYDFETSSQTFIVNGNPRTVSGTTLYLKSTGELSSEFYIFHLNNKFRITFVSTPVAGRPLESYPEQVEMLKTVLSTLTWKRVPDLTTPGTTCAEKYTQLLPGVWAQVVPGDPNRVRSAPSTSAEIISQLYTGTASLIIEGPICADGLVFWKVENPTIPGGIGWTAEGDGQEYWLEPLK